MLATGGHCATARRTKKQFDPGGDGNREQKLIIWPYFLEGHIDCRVQRGRLRWHWTDDIRDWTENSVGVHSCTGHWYICSWSLTFSNEDQNKQIYIFSNVKIILTIIECILKIYRTEWRPTCLTIFEVHSILINIRNLQVNIFSSLFLYIAIKVPVLQEIGPRAVCGCWNPSSIWWHCIYV